MHTGGGDGDVASASEDESSKEDEAVGDAAEASGSALNSDDDHEAPDIGQKRKASCLPDDMPKTKKAARGSAQAYSRNGPSKRVLDKFQKSAYYALIDAM